ncbi:MAG: ECF-type sigma factor, partial [Acidobacteriota bacterium]|nr:ECF-type sigma factor [Acidobacteriota bacterium]
MQLSRHLRHCIHRGVHRGVGQWIDSVCAKWLPSAANRPHTEAPPGNSMTYDVTELLREWRNGDEQALEKLTPLVYDELRRLAARYLRRERPNHTLQATALVNEAYLQLIAQPQLDWQNRAHFIGVAARLMRNILVDHARAHAAAKRGDGKDALPFDEAIAAPAKPAADVIALDDALKD